MSPRCSFTINKFQISDIYKLKKKKKKKEEEEEERKQTN